MKLYTLQEVAKISGANIALHGDAGVGKTSAILTMPTKTVKGQEGPILVLDADDGAKALVSRAKAVGFPPDKVLIARTSDFSSFENILDEFPKIVAEHRPATVAVDTLTMWLAELVDERFRAMKDRRKALEILSMQDWGVVSQRAKRILWMLKALGEQYGLHVLVNLHTSPPRDETEEGRPDLIRSLATLVPAMMDLVGYMMVKPDGTRGIVVSSMYVEIGKRKVRVYAKNRFGLTGMFPPDLAAILRQGWKNMKLVDKPKAKPEKAEEPTAEPTETEPVADEPQPSSAEDDWNLGGDA